MSISLPAVVLVLTAAVVTAGEVPRRHGMGDQRPTKSPTGRAGCLSALAVDHSLGLVGEAFALVARRVSSLQPHG